MKETIGMRDLEEYPRNLEHNRMTCPRDDNTSDTCGHVSGEEQ